MNHLSKFACRRRQILQHSNSGDDEWRRDGSGRSARWVGDGSLHCPTSRRYA